MPMGAGGASTKSDTLKEVVRGALWPMLAVFDSIEPVKRPWHDGGIAVFRRGMIACDSLDSTRLQR